jgi:hypothetical protein
MKGQWTLEKDIIQSIRDIKAKIDQAQMEEQRAERAGELSKVAEIRYGKIVQLRQDLEAANARLARFRSSTRCSRKRSLPRMLPQWWPNGPVFRWTGCWRAKRKSWCRPKKLSARG